MGREVRRVPANWRHPQDALGKHIPMHGQSFEKDRAAWEFEHAQWERGLIGDGKGGWEDGRPERRNMSFAEWYGPKPDQKDYMPDWPDEECTHLQMYETTTEGTPISPVMSNPEEMARWLHENRASVFGNATTSYDEWLAAIRQDLEASAKP